MDRPVLIVLGTRPEAIKLIPVYYQLKKRNVPVILCSTTQHTTLLDQVFNCFNVTPDIELHIMQEGQDLAYITQAVLTQVRHLIGQLHPALVLVQGDTSSAMAAALAAFYASVPVGHVEAGLRTNDLHSPFPEEMNRRFISLIATYHFAPTEAAAAHVLAQGAHRDTVFCTGNTIVDALHTIQHAIAHKQITIADHITKLIENARAAHQKIVLFTMHRRESFGTPMISVFETLKKLTAQFPDIAFIYPRHVNPQVTQAIEATQLREAPQVSIIDPVNYSELVYLLGAADWIMTDSGGIQEEATSIGKYTLVLRSHTERMEGVWAGSALVVGTHPDTIEKAVIRMHTQPPIVPPRTVYGDGTAAAKIAHIIDYTLHQEIKKTTLQHQELA